MEDQLAKGPQARLLASTTDQATHRDRPHEDLARPADSFFKSAQWSADGTTIFTSSSDNVVNSYVVPSDLLQPREDGPIPLRAQGSILLPESTHAIAPCPYFSLSNPYTHVILTGAVDHPIQLHQAFPPTSSDSPSPSPTPDPHHGPPSPAHRHPQHPQPPPIATYPLIHPPTESYLPALSLLWPSPGTHFLAGTKNLIAYFDATRSASGSGTAAPLLRLPTIPSTRHRAKGGGVGMRGAVSALAAHPDPGPAAGRLVAAGTWTRWLGLYDLARAGACVANWCVAGAGAAAGRGVGGAGILQVAWSPCGRYLVVNERKSSGMLVYDVRVTGKLLGWLAGRDADTHQRMTCDVFPGSDDRGGFEVWAGGRDGTVMVWEGVGNEEGYARSAWDWQAHGSAVGSTAMHMSGSVMATCSGSWKISGEESQSDDSDDSDDSNGYSGNASSHGEDRDYRLKPGVEVQDGSLKIWSIGAATSEEVDIEPNWPESGM